jgi:hypothetical protein
MKKKLISGGWSRDSLLAKRTLPWGVKAVRLRKWLAAGWISFGGDNNRFFADPPVGASLLAMDVNDYAFLLSERVVFTTIASKLAPTGDQVIKEIGNRWGGCQGAYRGCRRP